MLAKLGAQGSASSSLPRSEDRIGVTRLGKFKEVQFPDKLPLHGLHRIEEHWEKLSVAVSGSRAIPGATEIV